MVTKREATGDQKKGYGMARGVPFNSWVEGLCPFRKILGVLPAEIVNSDAALPLFRLYAEAFMWSR